MHFCQNVNVRKSLIWWFAWHIVSVMGQEEGAVPCVLPWLLRGDDEACGCDCIPGVCVLRGRGGVSMSTVVVLWWWWWWCIDETGVKLLPAPPGDGWPPLLLLASLCTTIRWGECKAGLCVIPTYNNKNTPRSQYVQQNKTKENHA